MIGNQSDARPGRFVRLSVADTGTGMSPEVLSHIFEPFYTTKPVGKGTGLGLATVYGIAKQHEGWTEVKSQLGVGSTFLIYLPICDAQSNPESTSLTPKPLRRGSETILVVEDEEAVRNFVVHVLEAHGYRTIAAESGPQALDRWQQHRGKINLMITDMMMPGDMTGRQLGERLTAQDPDLKVVYSSGYSPGMNGKDITVFQSKYFLPKPYTSAKLLEILGQCLDGQAN